MSMKKILMAAVAVSALSTGAASAATLSNASLVAGVSLAPFTPANLYEPYSIANELKLDATSEVATSLIITPTTGTTIGAGQYLVTVNVSGGTFNTTGLNTGSLTFNKTGPGAVTVNAVSTAPTSTGSQTFVVTVDAATFVTDATLVVPIKLGTARTPVVVSGSIVTQSGSVAVDGGTIAPVTIVDYRDGFTFGATANDAQLTLASSFKSFAVAGPHIATAATIGSAVGFGTTSSTTPATISDAVFGALTGGVPLTTAPITGATVTLTGDLGSFDALVTAQAPTAPLTAPGVFTATTSLATLLLKTATVSLNRKVTVPVGGLAGNASTYALGATVTTSALFTAPTFSSVALGSVSLEGTNFIASWVGDGSNGISYSIRLGNKSAAAVSSVKVALLNPFTTGTSGSVASTDSCDVGPLPASGELVITSANLTACFGAFKRSDVRITIQGLSSSLTAKMRTVAAGVVTEQTLGNGTVDALN